MSEGYKVTEFKLDRSGIRKILQSDGMLAALEESASAVGTGEVETQFVGFDRVHVLVRSNDDDN